MRVLTCGAFLLTLAACSSGGGSGTPRGSGFSGSPVVSGTIYGIQNNVINLNGGPNCGYVNVSYGNGTTIVTNGFALSAGSFAVVYGTGSCGTSLVANAITLPAGASQAGPSGSSASNAAAHVLTGDYLGGYAGSRTVTASQAAPLLSWAEVSPYDANNISAAGIKTLEYIDPFRQAATDPLYSSDESTFAHDCGGNRIPIYYQSVVQYLMNPNSTDLASVMNSWQVSQVAIGHIDAFFYDDIDTLYGVSSPPCDPPFASWDAANALFLGASQHSIVFNGYGMNGDSAALIGAPGVLGGMMEGCYADDGSATPPYVSGSSWIRNENLQIAAAASQKLMFCYNTPTSDAAASAPVRQYVYASFLLTYAPQSSVLWEYFSTPSGLHVFPETQVVPTSQLVSSPASIADLESPSGIYVREYASCSVAGKSVGACAAIVNPDATSSHAMPPLKQTYGHTMVLAGEGILDGGIVSVLGPAPPAVIPPETGFLLFP
jgi:hypothetical protein